jgi:hypothetical protein
VVQALPWKQQMVVVFGRDTQKTTHMTQRLYSCIATIHTTQTSRDTIQTVTS